jgi:hypothetical protein
LGCLCCTFRLNRALHPLHSRWNSRCNLSEVSSERILDILPCMLIENMLETHTLSIHCKVQTLCYVSSHLYTASLHSFSLRTISKVTLSKLMVWCRKVKFYSPLPESPSGRLLIGDPNRDPNLIQPRSKPDTNRDPMVAHRPLRVIYQVIYIAVTVTVILQRVFPSGTFLSHQAI